MNRAPAHHIVLVGNFLNHGTREVFQGVGAYVSGKNRFSLNWCHAVDTNDLRVHSAILKQADSFLVGNIIPHQATGSLENRMQFVRRKIRPGSRPCIFLVNDAKPLKMASISIDQIGVGTMAADHLWHRGYRHFAFFGLVTPPWSTLRRQGFERRLRELGGASQCFEFDSLQDLFTPSDQARRQGALYEWLRSLPKPCGILAANDHIGTVLIQAARHHGIRLPDQIGILGVDNEPFYNAIAEMPLSSIDLPFREHGYRAAELLNRVLHRQPVPRNTLLQPVRVVVRASTDMFMVRNPLISRAQTYIEARRQGPVRVGDLIRYLTTTKATLNKHFSQTLGTTPSEYILRRRLEYAAELLRTGQPSVEEVAANGGFSSRYYFGMVFKKWMGCTPGSLLFQHKRAKTKK